MEELKEPWDDKEAEYNVLVDVMLPAAQAQFDRAMTDWDAQDSKAIGLIALAAAAIAGLAASHESINDVWWLPAVGFFAACFLFGVSLWPRPALTGADLVAFHDVLRGLPPLLAARDMCSILIDVTRQNEQTRDAKGRYYLLGLGVLAVSAVVALAAVLMRP